MSHSLSASQSFGSILSLLISLISLIAVIADLSRLFYKNSLYFYIKSHENEEEPESDDDTVFKPRTLQDQFYFAGIKKNKYEYFMARYMNTFYLFRFVVFSIIIIIFQTQTVVQVILLGFTQLAYLAFFSSSSYKAKGHTSSGWMVQKTIVEILITTLLLILFGFSLDKYGNTFISSSVGEILQFFIALILIGILLLEGGAFIFFIINSAISMKSRKDLDSIIDIKNAEENSELNGVKINLKPNKRKSKKDLTRKMAKKSLKPESRPSKIINKPSEKLEVESSPENQLL